MRAFFTDMLYFERFGTLTKDAGTYPKFSQAVADSAREETLRSLLQHVVEREGDYREIFTMKETVINRSLAAVYRVPYASKEEWASYTFPENSGRSGILTQATFASLFSHPGGSSPTVRGKHLQEIFLCRVIPDPPADVDFSAVEAMGEGTVRERLTQHRNNPSCAACHIMMDPMGLALENFDSMGQWRTTENGEKIDVSAEIDGMPYTGATGVGEYLANNPETSRCLVQKAQQYGVGRPFDYRQYTYIAEQRDRFAENGFKVPELFRNLILDPTFFEVIVPDGLTLETTVAAVDVAPADQGGSK